jgi:hypothetical protein
MSFANRQGSETWVFVLHRKTHFLKYLKDAMVEIAGLIGYIVCPNLKWLSPSFRVASSWGLIAWSLAAACRTENDESS